MKSVRFSSPKLAAAAALSFLAGVGLYITGSHALMRRHAPARPFFSALREILRESLWVTLSQPIAPLFYFIGRRMTRGGAGTPVVFVHGYFQNRADFAFIARSLRDRGIGPLYGFNYLSLRDMPSIVRSLDAFVRGVMQETGSSKVDLVCHSMGGLVAAHFVASPGGADVVRRYVTIATPHRGVGYRGPILGAAREVLRRGHGIESLPELPCMSVYSTHDNLVFPTTTSELTGALTENVVVEGVGHLAILFMPQTAQAIGRFLGAPELPPQLQQVKIQASVELAGAVDGWRPASPRIGYTEGRRPTRVALRLAPFANEQLTATRSSAILVHRIDVPVRASTG